MPRIGVALLCLLLAPIIGVTQSDRASETASGSPGFQLTLEQLRSFTEVMSRVQRDYVEPVDDSVLFEHAIRGLVSGLDPYSSYLSPEQLTALKKATHGSYVGVGIELGGNAADGTTIVSVLEDSPARRAGIHRGDRLLQIDGKTVEGLDLSGVGLLLRGPVGSRVRLDLERGSESEALSVDLLRAQITASGVSNTRLPTGLLYLRLSTFQTDTVRDLQQALQAADQQGPPGGLVLDLRDNPGGLLEAAVAVADLFLSRGVIVSTRGRSSASNLSITADPNVRWPGMPMAILINHASASGAEIVAGALHDNDRAVLIGVRSFGKGSVQSVVTLPNGGGLKLTTAHYFTPNGAVIQGIGLTPDIEVAGDYKPDEPADDAPLQAAIKYLQQAKP